MNFARFCQLNARKFADREFLIESYPSRGERRSLTWRQLNDRSNALANYLVAECGVTKGDVVLHLMTNSIEWYVAYMAILKTGAAVTPLNFRFAANDIKYAADVTRCKAFILGQDFLPRIEPIRPHLSYVNRYLIVGDTVPAGMASYREITENEMRIEVLAESADDDMAELMFTSGTTGAPKPVCHTHGTLLYIAIGNALTTRDGYESVILAPHPFYHSGTLFLSFPSYIAAGKILMTMELEPESFLRSIAEEGCTGGWVSVPTWSDVIQAIKAGRIDPQAYDLSKVKHIEMGAQPVPQVLIEESRRIFPSLGVGVNYGITEGGGGGLIHLYPEDCARKAGSIGRATPFMEVKVVDGEGNTVPSGIIGELLIKGPRLMKEYAYNPEMTARTIEDGWLHTGDLVWMDEESFVFFADRMKDLIIRGGENIFPAEIEDMLRKHPKIADVAVLGYPHPRLVEIVMAVIQPLSSAVLSETDVIEFVKKQGLAKYKWPEKIIFAPVPRNPAGKIEKPKLRELYVKTG
ncbi:MAG TPA: class I adenylate-forming enzyme family protein [Syntrophorhabdales bacterium]|nr:class I adenylate-forming enzyme family protein [Syntrophorhabdales bacterium]